MFLLTFKYNINTEEVDNVIKDEKERSADFMMYPFLTLDDKTEIVHSEMYMNGSVKVYMERPDERDCFHYATCYLPEYK